jgi:hypothetical protein
MRKRALDRLSFDDGVAILFTAGRKISLVIELFVDDELKRLTIELTDLEAAKLAMALLDHAERVPQPVSRVAARRLKKVH